MKSLKYKIVLVEDKILEGVATKIYLVDKFSALTVEHDAGAMIRILSEGKVVLTLENGSVEEYPYSEGILKTENNVCSISLLK